MAKKTANAAEAPGARPTEARVRMYNVGFGDCFLVTFRYPRGERHMLIDFGSTAGPKRLGADYMTRVAKDIQAECGKKLHMVVATHRHRDHISGFATDGSGTGKIIRDLNPDVVVQPWTEDPKAPVSGKKAAAKVYRDGKPDFHAMTGGYLMALADMHAVANSVLGSVRSNAVAAGRDKRAEIEFLGEDNLTNLSAVQNLMGMGNKGVAIYANAGMQLDALLPKDLLPGVKITVLGPPTLEQSNAIRTERARDPNEFWQFRRFWGVQRAAAAGLGVHTNALPFPKVAENEREPKVRWFIKKSRAIQADQMLELVRDLDKVMNNTSLILLMEIGKKKLLFPGDAQIENWAYALNQPAWCKLLKDVDLYKVGHHGSLNATPKSLWGLFARKDEAGEERLTSLCSTKAGKHGSVSSGTEVPRKSLVAELKAKSDFHSTEEIKSNPLCDDVVVSFAR
jgi:hypothetical protein